MFSQSKSVTLDICINLHIRVVLITYCLHLSLHFSSLFPLQAHQTFPVLQETVEAEAAGNEDAETGKNNGENCPAISLLPRRRTKAVEHLGVVVHRGLWELVEI